MIADTSSSSNKSGIVRVAKASIRVPEVSTLTSSLTVCPVTACTNGIFVNTPTRVTGQINGGISFDGEDDYIKCSNPFYKYNKEISVIGWLWYDSSSNECLH